MSSYLFSTRSSVPLLGRGAPPTRPSMKADDSCGGSSINERPKLVHRWWEDIDGWPFDDHRHVIDRSSASCRIGAGVFQNSPAADAFSSVPFSGLPTLASIDSITNTCFLPTIAFAYSV